MLLAVSIISGIVCFIGGAVYGVLPLKEDQQTAQQKTVSRTFGIIIIGLFIILIFLGQDVASWIVIIAALAGFGVGKIPPLRKVLTNRWKFFRHKNVKTLSPRKAKKRQQQAK
jgi:dolichol kinase